MKKRLLSASIALCVFAQPALAQETQDGAQQAQDVTDDMFAPGGPVDQYAKEIEAYEVESERKRKAAIGGTDLYVKGAMGADPARGIKAPNYNIFSTGDLAEPFEVHFAYDIPSADNFEETKILTKSDFDSGLAIFSWPELCAQTKPVELIKVTITIDPGNKIAEYDEDNNVVTRALPIFKCQ